MSGETAAALASLASAFAVVAVATAPSDPVLTRAGLSERVPRVRPVRTGLRQIGRLGRPLRLPELLLARAARRRSREASREVPLFLDLLAVATSAGLAPQLAVRLAVEPLRGPLAAELRSAVARADLGRRWRDEVKTAADRLALPDLRRAVALLLRTETLGASLADEMARLASDVRESRRSRAGERARTAPVKMLFPLVFLILPAFLLLTVVPVLLSTVRSID